MAFWETNNQTMTSGVHLILQVLTQRKHHKSSKNLEFGITAHTNRYQPVVTSILPVWSQVTFPFLVIWSAHLLSWFSKEIWASLAVLHVYFNFSWTWHADLLPDLDIIGSFPCLFQLWLNLAWCPAFLYV